MGGVLVPVFQLITSLHHLRHFFALASRMGERWGWPLTYYLYIEHEVCAMESVSQNVNSTEPRLNAIIISTLSFNL